MFGCHLITLLQHRWPLMEKVVNTLTTTNIVYKYFPFRRKTSPIKFLVLAESQYRTQLYVRKQFSKRSN